MRTSCNAAGSFSRPLFADAWLSLPVAPSSALLSPAAPFSALNLLSAHTAVPSTSACGIIHPSGATQSPPSQTNAFHPPFLSFSVMQCTSSCRKTDSSSSAIDASWLRGSAEARKMTMRFDGRRVEYPLSECAMSEIRTGMRCLEGCVSKNPFNFEYVLSANDESRQACASSSCGA